MLLVLAPATPKLSVLVPSTPGPLSVFSPHTAASVVDDCSCTVMRVAPIHSLPLELHLQLLHPPPFGLRIVLSPAHLVSVRSYPLNGIVIPSTIYPGGAALNATSSPNLVDAPGQKCLTWTTLSHYSERIHCNVFNVLAGSVSGLVGSNTSQRWAFVSYPRTSV